MLEVVLASDKTHHSVITGQQTLRDANHLHVNEVYGKQTPSSMLVSTIIQSGDI